MYWGNIFFSAVFLLEALVKLLALGWRDYIADGWCKFDFTLVGAAYRAHHLSL